MDRTNSADIIGRGGRLIEKDWFVLSLFALIALALYFPVLGNGFLTDDYASLYRILVEKRILYREMLRPLIDISFYFNFLYSGLHPLGYYLFNLCVHILVCFMVYKVAGVLPMFGGVGDGGGDPMSRGVGDGGGDPMSRAVGYPGDRQRIFALLSGLLFAFYPFHNESIVWLSGRLSSMAVLCALAAIYFSLTKRAPWGFLLAALLLIIGLFAYESILVLPAIILVLRADLSRSRTKFFRAVAAWSAVGCICVLIRYVVAGTLVPDYGRDSIAMKEGNGIFFRLFKALGRCVLPPSDATGRMMVLFAVTAGLIVLLHFLLWKRRGRYGFSSGTYMRLSVVFVLAMAAPVISAVSTRTSEGDRLLYFPSCFLCMMASALFLQLAEKKWVRWSLPVLFFAGGILFIEENNQHWRVASRTAGVILDTLKASQADHTILINAPDEWEGAFIFRNNFDRALSIHEIPVSGVYVNNYLLRNEYRLVEGTIVVSGHGDSLSIYPVTRIFWKSGHIEIDNLQTGTSQMAPLQGTKLYYWDKVRLERVVLQ